MSKKLMSLVLILMLLMTGVVYAVGPSKRTGDLTSASVVPKPGVNIDPSFGIDTKGETEFSKAVFKDLTNIKVVDYFPQEILGQLPSDMNVDKLEINEFMPLNLLNYDVAYGEMTIAFNFPTPYVPGQAIASMVGIDSGNGPQWAVVPCDVVDDGSVEITFSADIMELIATRGAVLVILSESAA